MPFIEAPTTFYLGRRYNPQTQRLTDDVVYYDSRNLMTHAVVVGMTGSGKTGLCISLLEEAVLDNIPAIIIDPKGDITNMVLTFPNLSPEEFKPWINPDEALRSNMSLDAYAKDVANRWRDGLQSWGIVPDRLRWLQVATQYSIYTPGSDAGLPISILASLRAPKEGWFGNEEALREKINGITTALLALVGKDSSSVDKEHVLIANIFENAWQQGQDLTLEDIILQIQKPPFEKLGVFPIDQYMSERSRVKLAMELNSIIAAPSFQSWLQGQPIDIPSLLRQDNGRPRVSIFYIAHLSDQERLFIITLLLENLLSWMRTQPGTTSLRALLYIDEMFGYFPPYPKNPPTKEPMLRLLKQARAFGLGLILATQNPGDLDYKGLSNAGTWFIGRLQSENDRRKVMSGLEQMASAAEGLNLNDVEQMIADVAPRVFLMRNVHDENGPLLMHTRWVMNYLAGPLTRQQIQLLMQDQRQQLMQRVAMQYGRQNPNAAWGAGRAQPQMPVPGGPPAPPPLPQNIPPGPPPGVPGAPPGLPGMPGMAGVTQFNAQSAPSLPNPHQQGWSQQGWGQPGWTQQNTLSASQANFPAPSPYDSQATAPAPRAPSGFSQNQPPVSSSVAQYYLPVRVSSQQGLTEWAQQNGQHPQAVNGISLVYKPMLMAQAVVRFQEKKANLFIARIYAYRVPDLQRAGIIHWDDYFADPVDARTIDREPFNQALFADLPPGLADDSRMKAIRGEVVDMLYTTARLPIPFNPDLKIYGDPDATPGEFQAAVEQAAREQRDVELDKLSNKYGSMMEKLEKQLEDKERELRAEQKEMADRRREELFTAGEALHGLWRGHTAFTLSRMSRATRYRRQTKEDIRESHDALSELEQKIDATEREFEVALQAINEKWARIAANTQEHIITPYKKDIQLELFGISWVPQWYMNINGQNVMISAF